MDRKYQENWILFGDKGRYRGKIDINMLEHLGQQWHSKCCTDRAEFSICDVGLLLEELGLKLKITEGLGDRGEITNNIVLLNARLKDERAKQSTILHECAHKILEHSPIIVLPGLNNQDIAYRYGLMEYEASYLAGALLMPRKLFLNVFRSTKWSFNRTAKYFGVDEPEVMTRLQQLANRYLDIPSHYIKTVNQRFDEFDSTDCYKPPGNGGLITDQYQALLRAQDYYLSYKVKRLALVELFNGKAFANFVLTYDLAPHLIISHCYGIPIEYAKEFRFYKQFQKLGSVFGEHSKKIKRPRRNLIWPVTEFYKKLVIYRQMKAQTGQRYPIGTFLTGIGLTVLALSVGFFPDVFSAHVKLIISALFFILGALFTILGIFFVLRELPKR